MSSISAYLIAGLKSLALILMICEFFCSDCCGITGAGMVIVVVNGGNGVVKIGAMAEISSILVALAAIVGTIASTISGVALSSFFLSPEYLMRG